MDDSDWWSNTSDDTKHKIPKWLNSDRSSADVDVKSVIHVISRALAS